MTATALTVRFTVLGRPQQKGSKQVLPVKGPRRFVVRESNIKARPWAMHVAAAALDAHYTTSLITGPVIVAVTFYFARPKGHYGTGRNQQELRRSAPREMTVMPDVDKLARCALDALTGIVFRDDAQIVDLHAAKRYGEPERADFIVRELQPPPPIEGA